MCIATSAGAQDVITFTWEADTTKKSVFLSFLSPCEELTVNWGDDSSIDTCNVEEYISLVHKYVNAGLYTVIIVTSNENYCPTSFWCPNERINYLDVSGAPALTSLSCESNQLKNLDVSSNTTLTILQCSNNQLKNLDVSSNTALTILFCSHNLLTYLDLKNNITLEWLDCKSNHLDSLVLNQNTELISLDCRYNHLPLSELYNISISLSDTATKLLHMQTLGADTVMTGVELFTDQAVFNDIFTDYHLWLDGFPYAPPGHYTIKDGILIFNKTGNYSVWMCNTAIDSDCQVEVLIKLNVIHNIGISTNTISTIQVYPNPTNYELRITNYELQMGSVEIFDIMGRMQNAECRMQNAEEEMVIDISHLQAGIYFLKIDNQTIKIIKN